MKRPPFALVAMLIAIACPSCRRLDTTAEARPAIVEPPNAGADAPKRGGVRLNPSQLNQIELVELSVNTSADVIHATGTVEFNR